MYRPCKRTGCEFGGRSKSAAPNDSAVGGKHRPSVAFPNRYAGLLKEELDLFLVCLPHCPVPIAGSPVTQLKSTNPGQRRYRGNLLPVQFIYQTIIRTP